MRIECEQYPNPDALGFHTDFDLQGSDDLRNEISKLSGVEEVHNFGHKYHFSLLKGHLFNAQDVSDRVIYVVKEWYKSKYESED